MSDAIVSEFSTVFDHWCGTIMFFLGLEKLPRMAPFSGWGLLPQTLSGDTRKMESNMNNEQNTAVLQPRSISNYTEEVGQS